MQCTNCQFSLNSLEALTERRCPSCGLAFEPEPGSVWDVFKAGFAMIWLWRKFYLAFFIGLGLIVLLLPNARANAQNAGLGYTLKLIAGISAVMASLIFLWGIGGAVFFLIRERFERREADSSDGDGPRPR